MRAPSWLTMISPLLLVVLAFGQAEPPTTRQPTITQQPATQSPLNRQPANPQSVADAARVSKKALASAPVKVYRNKDLRNSNSRDGKDVASPTTRDRSTAATSAASPPTPTPSYPATQPLDDTLKGKDAAFESQGKILRNQVLVQKGKIVGIQNQITSLSDQFAAWSSAYSQDYETPVCWTSLHDSLYYKAWCDT